MRPRVPRRTRATRSPLGVLGARVRAVLQQRLDHRVASTLRGDNRRSRSKPPPPPLTSAPRAIASIADATSPVAHADANSSAIRNPHPARDVRATHVFRRDVRAWRRENPSPTVSSEVSTRRRRSRANRPVAAYVPFTDAVSSDAVSSDVHPATLHTRSPWLSPSRNMATTSVHARRPACTITLLMWTPSCRCTPPHWMHSITPRLSDAQSGPPCRNPRTRRSGRRAKFGERRRPRRRGGPRFRRSPRRDAARDRRRRRQPAGSPSTSLASNCRRASTRNSSIARATLLRDQTNSIASDSAGSATATLGASRGGLEIADTENLNGVGVVE